MISERSNFNLRLSSTCWWSRVSCRDATTGSEVAICNYIRNELWDLRPYFGDMLSCFPGADNTRLACKGPIPIVCSTPWANVLVTIVFAYCVRAKAAFGSFDRRTSVRTRSSHKLSFDVGTRWLRIQLMSCHMAILTAENNSKILPIRELGGQSCLLAAQTRMGSDPVNKASNTYDIWVLVISRLATNLSASWNVNVARTGR